MKIGLFGGTFNPVHNGHLIIAEAARVHFSLDKVVFIPTRRPPHKEFNPSIPDERRLSLLINAIIDNPHFAVSDYEFQTEKQTYAIDTCAYFKEVYKDAELLYLIGKDHIALLPDWKDIDTLHKELRFIVAARMDTTKQEVSPYGVEYFPSPLIQISSSMIRDYCSSGKSVRYLVPYPVYQAISEEGLYSERETGA